MKRTQKGLATAAGIILVSLCLMLRPTCGGVYTNLVVFGDSLSDAGNLDQEGLIGELIALFAEVGPTGTFSNGPVWHDYLVDSIGLSRAQPSLEGGSNYAFGGAETDRGGAIESFLSGLLLGQQTGIEEQVEIFIDGLPGAGADSERLYVLWGGGNDMRGEASPAAAAPAVDNLEQRVRSLAAVGVRNLLVPNLPNLGRTPESISQGVAAQQLAETIAVAFNSDLRTTMDNLAAELSLNLLQLDVFAIMEEVVADPQAFGFTNVTQPCLDPESACTGFFFWDEIHPTTAAHEILGNRAFGLLAEAAIGDFDLDSDVDGADFLAWQRGEVSNPPSQLDLDNWRANFGYVASSAAATSTAVPEPTTGIMLMLGMAVVLFGRGLIVPKLNCSNHPFWNKGDRII